MTYNLNLAQVFLEASLLSESTTTLSVVAVVAALVAVLRRLREQRPAGSLIVLLGFLAGFAILIRAQFVFLPLLLPAIVGYASARPRFRTGHVVKNAILCVLPTALLVLAWCAAVYAKTGYFTLSTQSGLGFSNASIAFTEHAPDRYAAIRDTLLKYRELRRARGDPDYNTMWEALPEIMEKTGMSLPEVSREIQRMSIELFARHPLKYARNVAESWVSFWLAPNPWRPDQLSPQWLAPPLAAIWWVEHKVLRLLNASFVLLVAAVGFSRRMRERTRWDLELTSISAVILASSIIQALPEFGASARYGVTVQALTVLVVMVAALRFRETRPRAAPRPEPA
jgi:4-amino-4-deoxy-L-arabinose transferase-like glycosyltransferase